MGYPGQRIITPLPQEVNRHTSRRVSSSLALQTAAARCTGEEVGGRQSDGGGAAAACSDLRGRLRAKERCVRGGRGLPPVLETGPAR